MSDLDKYDKIERYLGGKMSQEEQDSFEKEVQQDLDLRKELKSQAILAYGASERFEGSWKNNFSQWEKETPDSVRFDSLSFRMVAVLIGLLILAGILIWRNTQSVPLKDLYAANFSNISTDATVRSDSVRLPTDWENAKARYDEGKYQESIEHFQNILKNEKPDRDVNIVRLYLASSYMYLEQHNKAISQLEQIDPLSNTGMEARWNLALCYLYLEKPAQATLVLEYISKSKNAGLWKKKADQLLQHLSY